MPAEVSRPTVTRWLLGVTRGVPAPLGASALCRFLFLLADLVLLGGGLVAALRLASGQPVGPIDSVGSFVIALVVLCLVKALLRYLEQFLGHLVAFRSLELLRTEVFSRLHPQAPAIVPRLRSGDALERITRDIERLEVLFAHTPAPVLTALLVPLVSVTVIGTAVSWPVAVVSAIGLGLAVLLVPALGVRATARLTTRTAAARGRLTHSVTDTVQGITEVVGYGHQRARLAQADALADEIADSGRRMSRVSATRLVLSSILQLLTPLLVVLVGAGTGDDPVLLAGAAVITLRSFRATSAIDELGSDLDAAFASAQRLHRVAHADPAVTDPEAPRPLPTGPLEVCWEGTSLTYGSEDGQARSPALDQVTAVAPAGRRTCIVGPSGAGKSTLARLLLRDIDPTAGRVTLGGEDLARVSLAQLRREVSLVAQSTFLFDGTVTENLRLAAPDATDEEIRSACRRAHISADIEALPDGYGTRLGARAGRLSGGQRQRLSLARALLRGSRVLVLDEHTAHLDTELADSLAAALRELPEGTTVIEITHRVTSSLSADHVIVLDDGRCVQAGPPDTLRGHGPYASLLDRETAPAHP
jgi:ATP-binding cassette subfamily C protein